MKHKDTVFSTPQLEGKERAAVLIIIPQMEARYLVYRWSRFSDHWLLEITTGDQVEVFCPNILIHIPRAGYTFDLDGTAREVNDIRQVTLQ